MVSKIMEWEMINIEELTPSMKKGYVAMNRNGYWTWFDKEPYPDETCGFWRGLGKAVYLKDCFSIMPAEDWKKSLRKVG